MSYDPLLHRISYPHFKNPSLLTEALTHRSFVEEHPWAGNDQQRLEWLGDSFLQYQISRWLYERHPTSQEGELTALRKIFAEGSWHAQVAEALDLARYVRRGRGELTNTSNQRLGKDTLEALIGAILLDSNAETAWLVFLGLMRIVPPNLEPSSSSSSSSSSIDARDPIVALGEWWQKTYRESMPKPEYHRIGGPDHAPIFECRIVLPDSGIEAVGSSTNKQEARRQACQHALELLELASIPGLDSSQLF